MNQKENEAAGIFHPSAFLLHPYCADATGFAGRRSFMPGTTTVLSVPLSVVLFRSWIAAQASSSPSWLVAILRSVSLSFTVYQYSGDAAGVMAGAGLAA